MKVALVVGHRPGDPGAVNEASGETEFKFNKQLAEDVSMQLDDRGIYVKTIYRDDAGGGLSHLPDKINNAAPDFIVSLHCNAFNTMATGTETLYYHSSAPGKMMAEIMQRHLVAALYLRNRGIQPKRSEDRGGYLMRYTHAPCIIAEPFFIDNDMDLNVAQNHYSELVKAYADAIEEIAGVIHA